MFMEILLTFPVSVYCFVVLCFVLPCFVLFYFVLFCSFACSYVCLFAFQNVVFKLFQGKNYCIRPYLLRFKIQLLV